jgi:hypothetical protein
VGAIELVSHVLSLKDLPFELENVHLDSKVQVHRLDFERVIPGIEIVIPGIY